MSRHAFWTIIVGGTPTAFRAPLREDLLPTLVQLQRKDPAAVIRWFEKGQLWETPGDAQDAALAKRNADRPKRGAAWRPGGEHKDPREKYKQPRDVKRKKWAAQAADGRGPWVKGEARAQAPGRKRPPTGGARPAPRGPRTADREEGPPIPGRTPAPRAGHDNRRPPTGSRTPPYGRDTEPGSSRPPQDRRPPSGDRRPTGGDRKPPFGDRRPSDSDRRPAAADRRRPSGQRPPENKDGRPASGDRRPSGGDRRPPRAPGRPPYRDAGSSRPPSSGRPTKPQTTPPTKPPTAAPARKPRVFKAGEMPPKRKKREDE